MVYKHLLIFVTSLFSTILIGQVEQVEYQYSNDLKGIIYRKEFSVDLRIHTNGFALGVSIGKFPTYYKTNYYHLELGLMCDPREQTQSGIILPAFQVLSDSYKYGKQNSLFMLRGSIGTKRYLTEKARRKGISVGYDYSFGPSIAMLKPYYLDLIYHIEENGQSYDETRAEKYSEANAQKFLDSSQIFGHSGFGKGFSELSIVPGVQAMCSLFFSVGSYDKYLKSLEVGLMADVYFQKIPILVETSSVSNKPYFINLFLNLQLGKRSN